MEELSFPYAHIAPFPLNCALCCLLSVVCWYGI